jgi:hypothetical protein
MKEAHKDKLKGLLNKKYYKYFVLKISINMQKLQILSNNILTICLKWSYLEWINKNGIS